MQPVTYSAVGAAQRGPPVVYMPVPTRTNNFDRYKHKQSIGLGIAQIIIGILCIIFNSVCLGVAASHDPSNGLGVVGHGYWCGILFLITGIFGITAGKTKTRCQVVTFMALCIISATFTIALLIIGITGALTTDKTHCLYESYYGYYYNSYSLRYRWVCNTLPDYEVIIAMESCLAFFGFIEVILAIWGSVICCTSGVCCCSSPAMVTPTVGYVSYNGQVITITQTQGGPYVYPPQPTFSYLQGPMPPSAYVQTDWTMPTANIGPVFGHAPPSYTTYPTQSPWIVPLATTNPGPMAAQALPIDPVPNQAKEIRGYNEGSSV